MTEWGPWIEHDGKGCPCTGEYCRMEFLDGEIMDGIAGIGGGYSWMWASPTWGGAIIAPEGHIAIPLLRYRIRKPRGLQILESILSEVDAPVREVTV